MSSAAVKADKEIGRPALLMNPGALRDAWQAAGWIALFMLLVATIQWAIPYPLDDDTAYHFSVARLIREHGILQNFPWTRFSWQSVHYADKELLFHLLFVPFTGFGYDSAARIVGTISGTSLLAALFFVLRAERVKYAPLWSLLPLGTTVFLYRFCQVRPHLFSIMLAILVLCAYCRMRTPMLFMTSLLYPLFYVAFWQIPLLVVVAAEAGRVMAGERFKWQPLGAIVTGVVLGVLIHPNGWNLLQMNWIHMTDILFRNAWGQHVEFNMGEEFDPFTLSGWLRDLAAPTVAMLIAAWVAWRSRHEERLLSSCTITALLFLVLTMRSNRFLEYLVPFAVLALALASQKIGKRWLLPVFAALTFCWSALAGTPLLQYIFSQQPRIWQMSREAGNALRKGVPAGSTVFTCGWEYSGTLMAEAPDRFYMVALDPTLLYKRDPEMYGLWYQTMKEAPSTSADIVRHNFASRYIVCLDHPTLHPFFNAIAADKEVQTLYSDGKWVLFDLGNSNGTAR